MNVYKESITGKNVLMGIILGIYWGYIGIMEGNGNYYLGLRASHNVSTSFVFKNT